MIKNIMANATYAPSSYLGFYSENAFNDFNYKKYKNEMEKVKQSVQQDGALLDRQYNDLFQQSQDELKNDKTYKSYKGWCQVNKDKISYKNIRGPREYK